MFKPFFIALTLLICQIQLVAQYSAFANSEIAERLIRNCFVLICNAEFRSSYHDSTLCLGVYTNKNDVDSIKYIINIYEFDIKNNKLGFTFENLRTLDICSKLFKTQYAKPKYTLTVGSYKVMVTCRDTKFKVSDLEKLPLLSPFSKKDSLRYINLREDDKIIGALKSRGPRIATMKDYYFNGKFETITEIGFYNFKQYENKLPEQIKIESR